MGWKEASACLAMARARAKVGREGEGGEWGNRELVESCEGRVRETEDPPHPPAYPSHLFISVNEALRGRVPRGQQDDHKTTQTPPHRTGSCLQDARLHPA